MMKKGHIFEGRDRKKSAALHYIVYFGKHTDSTFIGVVLTHSSQGSNIRMSKHHFKKTDEQGGEFKFKYENTYIVGRLFIKPEGWGPYLRIGELTEEGIQFVESEIENKEPTTWDEFI